VFSERDPHAEFMTGPRRDRTLPRVTVLVVDDDPKFAHIVVRCLDRAGYHCAAAHSGDEALGAMDDLKPDVVVLDVMMPGLSGIDVCQRLRAEGWTGGVVIVSARGNWTDRADALRAGADAFLAKPVPLAELVAAVDEL
jgi:DNA-binding response OmpR family regulator